MMQLVLTVMGIALAALLAVGGINYFSTDIGLRVEVSQGLRAQHDALAAAISNYGIANNGYVPVAIERLKGFLPDGKVPEFPRLPKAFTWSISKSQDGSKHWLCLAANGVSSPSRAAREGVASFVRDLTNKFPGTVYYGLPVANAKEYGCGLPGDADGVPESLRARPADDLVDGLTADRIVTGTTISIEGV